MGVRAGPDELSDSFTLPAPEAKSSATVWHIKAHTKPTINYCTCYICHKKDFDTREVGHATFQVQHQVEKILSSFESRVITELVSLQQKLFLSTNEDSSLSDLTSTIESDR